MKSLRLTLAVSLTLLWISHAGYSQPPVIDESDEYSLAINMQETPNANGVSKSAETEEEMWQDETPADDQQQPLVKNKSTEAADVDGDSLAEQVHNLQAEIQELRGQIEVQAHDLKMLQQQQLAFYKDLDSRLQQHKTEQNPETASDSTLSPAIKVANANNGKSDNPADEQISYLAAYELVKTKKFDEGLEAMRQFIERYPSSGYSANAYYWMGELYLVKNDNEHALKAFNTVLGKFPKSSKAAASQLKAGYALANLGQMDAARAKLRSVINHYPDTKTAQLAKQKLDSMN